MQDYQDFIESKKICPAPAGFTVTKEELNPALFTWQKDITIWALKRGKAALFEDCGLGKTLQELEFGTQVCKHTKQPVLIVCPLSVADQTLREAIKFGYKSVKVCRSQEDVINGINITNYEMLEHFDASVFSGVILDESSILKSYNGAYRNQLINAFRDTPYKLEASATPAPNDYMEFGNQSEFLGVMKRTEMLATFFVHDGGETSKWRLKGHAEKKFWEWLATWAVVLTSPADLGYDASDFVLPSLNMHQEIVEPEGLSEDESKIASTLSERRQARKRSLEDRCAKVKQIVDDADPDEKFVIWCDLNIEQDTLAKMFGDKCVSIQGSTKRDDKIQLEKEWREGNVPVMVTKPKCFGWGLNWQHCSKEIFVGLSDSYEMFYQALRRCYRFGQENDVDVWIVISKQEGNVLANVQRKEDLAKTMIREMTDHTREILEEEIRGLVRTSIPYNPTIEMKIPIWVKGDVA